MSRALPLLLVALASVSPRAAGGVQISFHERYVEAVVRDEAGTVFDSERYDAPDLAPFQEQAAAQADLNPSGIPFPRWGSGHAEQNSSFGLSDVTASGYADGGALGFDILGEARSQLEIVFEISSLISYSIGGWVSSDAGIFDAVVSLSEAGNPSSGFTFRDSVSDDEQAEPFYASGILAPGVYRLRAFANACGQEGGGGLCGTGSGASSSAFSFVLTIPEPSTGALLGVGLAALGAARLRARRRA